MKIFSRIKEKNDETRLSLLVLTLIRNKVPAIVLSDQSQSYQIDIFSKNQLDTKDYIDIAPASIPLPTSINNPFESGYKNLLNIVKEIKTKWEAGLFIEGKWCIVGGFILYYTLGMFLAINYKLEGSNVIILKED